jgi:hypothetical protein
MNTMTSKEFCTSHGISRMTLSRWRNAGRISVTSDGTIDVEESDAALREAGLGRFRLADVPPATDPDGLTLPEAHRRHAVAVAQARTQAYTELRNSWMPVDAARHYWAEDAKGLRWFFTDIEQDGAEATASGTMPAIAAKLKDLVHAQLAQAVHGHYFKAMQWIPGPALADDSDEHSRDREARFVDQAKEP